MSESRLQDQRGFDAGPFDLTSCFLSFTLDPDESRVESPCGARQAPSGSCCWPEPAAGEGHGLRWFYRRHNTGISFSNRMPGTSSS